MDRSVLERPFPDDRVRHRSTSDGTRLSFVTAADVIERLNAAFEAAWSFTVVEHAFDGDEVIVTGRLVAGDVTKEDFGGARLDGCTRADALKAATSDALKRCARMLGVGLDLWRGGEPASDDHQVLGGRGGRGATQAQVRTLRGLGADLGIDMDALAIERFGAQVTELNKRDASSLISELIEARKKSRRAG